MYTQGVSPGLDFSDMRSVIEIVERCNKIPVPARAPYGGDLVVCAFSGSHQDAIKKGFALQQKKRAQGETLWRIPYLPLDPKDIGRDYEAVIRVNSQSGKGGAAWVILRSLGLDTPRNMQMQFSTIVQNEADTRGKELSAEEITALFKSTYNYNNETHQYVSLLDYDVKKIDNDRRILTGQVEINDKIIPIKGIGNGPISSLVDALSNLFNVKFGVENYTEHALGSGSKTQAASFIHISYRDAATNEKEYSWGVGVSEDVGEASVRAIFSTINSIIHSGEVTLPTENN
ncbi:LeuA allosteric (dimerization) domain [Nakaseomyces glabratus]|nr:LeuA allosteric (dimerization) domain [Nakaseomyces glabratus]